MTETQKKLLKFDKIVSVIYKTQNKYEKYYKVRYVAEDLHIQGLYLHNLLKVLRAEFSRDELKENLHLLKNFNISKCLYLTNWFFNVLLDYNYK